MLKVKQKGSLQELQLVRGSPVYWYFYDENAKLLERVREHEDREANLVRDWVCCVKMYCVLYKHLRRMRAHFCDASCAHVALNTGNAPSKGTCKIGSDIG